MLPKKKKKCVVKWRTTWRLGNRVRNAGIIFWSLISPFHQSDGSVRKIEREWRSFSPHLVSPPFIYAQSLQLSPNRLLLLLHFTFLPLFPPFLFTPIPSSSPSTLLLSSPFAPSTILPIFIGISPFQHSILEATTYHRLPKMRLRMSRLLKSTVTIVRKILPRRISIRLENSNLRSTALGRG